MDALYMEFVNAVWVGRSCHLFILLEIVQANFTGIGWLVDLNRSHNQQGQVDGFLGGGGGLLYRGSVGAGSPRTLDSPVPFSAFKVE
jgi:hypothetical protein